MKALEQRMVTEARWRLAAGEAGAGSGLVLTTRSADPLDSRKFHRLFKARAAAAEVPVISVPATHKELRLAARGPGHPPEGVDVAILRHSKIAETMDI